MTDTVTVKPLVWSSAGIWGNQPAYYADSAMGWVQIVDHRQHGNGFRVYPAWEESDEGNYEDLETAKAAAQADYERRVRSALEPQTPAQAARVSYHLKWIAGARPPAHPTPMKGTCAFASFDNAIAHFTSQAPDAKFVRLKRIVTTEVDVSDDALRAIAGGE